MKSDNVSNMLFNKESNLRCMHFRGYYVVGPEKGTLPVYDNKVVELPLVGT
jgi:hypothetical protein